MAITSESNHSSNPSPARPAHEIRMGRIRAAIWENETSGGTRFNVTVGRLYKDGGSWKDSQSFGRDDLPLVAKVVDRCHSWIFSQKETSDSDATANDREF